MMRSLEQSLTPRPRHSPASRCPCKYRIYFRDRPGDTEEEIKQAVAMAAIVRHWSSMQVDFATFKKQTGAMLGGADQAVTARTSPQSAAGRPGPAASGHKEVKMLTAFKPVTGAAIKQAIEGRDGRMLSSFYADDAVVRVIDRNNPPSKPREVRGRAAITTFWDDICGRAMTHKVDTSIADGERLAFTQDCAYPDGTKVFCIATLELRDGKIVRQTVVQAWDE